jgi:hypothetical protein
VASIEALGQHHKLKHGEATVGKHAWLAGQAIKTRAQRQGRRKELTGELTEERGRRPWRRHRQRSHGCVSEATILWLRRRGAASCSRPSGQAQHLGATSGLQACRPTDEATEVPPQAPRSGKKLQRGQPEQIEPQGQDPLGEAQRRWRRMEVRSTNPHGQMEALDEAERLPHRAAVELAGARRNRTRESSAIRNRQRGLGLGRDRVRERVRGRPAGPSWSGQAHSG